MKSSISTVAALLGFGSMISAQFVSNCAKSDSNLCYQLNVPDASASSGTGDIYMQIKAPTTYSWVALGQGSKMAGSNIFVVYTDASGSNVTVSPRLGTGHNMPEYDTAANITILGGSGVSNGVMTANIRCSNCDSWQGGSMDFSSSSSNWIRAWKSGSPLNSDDKSASIVQHNDMGAFTWDLTQASGGSSANPFVTTSAATSGSSDTTPSTATSSGDTGVQSTSSDSSSASDDSPSASNSMLLAHGVLATIAFVALFPIGAILIRIATFSGSIWVHAGIQAFAYVFVIVAAGMGIYMARLQDQLSEHHIIVGLLLLSLLFFQPILGILHHKQYKKTGHRSVWAYLHLAIGRVGILLGLINGGTGLALAGASKSAYIAYGVCAGVVGVVYLAVMIFGEVKRSKDTGSARGGEKMQMRESSSE